MYQTIKKQIFGIIQPAEKGNLPSRIFDLFIMALILFSVVSVFIMTFRIPRPAAVCLIRLERFSLWVFAVEYLLRIWTADLLHPDLPPLRARLRYIRSGMAVIDLITVLPFFLPMLIPMNLIGVRAFRLLRLLRIFKMNRYSDALAAIGNVFRTKAHEMLASLFFVSVLLVISSLLIYYAEHDAQPELFSNAFSGLWWAVATLTTVGYGDIYPVTAAGRILGAVMAIMGIGMVAVPTGILSSGFLEMLEEKKKNSPSGGPDREDAPEKKTDPPRYCPHCGKKL